VYKNLVRSHSDYCNGVWNRYRKADIETLEKVQKRATKILPKLRHLKYSERLKNVPYISKLFSQQTKMATSIFTYKISLMYAC